MKYLLSIGVVFLVAWIQANRICAAQTALRTLSMAGADLKICQEEKRNLKLLTVDLHIKISLTLAYAALIGTSLDAVHKDVLQIFLLSSRVLILDKPFFFPLRQFFHLPGLKTVKLIEKMKQLAVG